MSKNCTIMTRMKTNYENRSKTFLTRRVPVIMRLDGKSFHTFTKGLDKPFDEGLIEDMQQTAIFLCQNIQGAKCAYVQSDEISILITDYDTLQTDAWFDYNVQKMTSISAGFAASKFNQLRFKRKLKDITELDGNLPTFVVEQIEDSLDYTLANFDSRVSNYPKEEVINYFLARQKDAVKNSIAMLAQSLYSPNELNGVNQSQMQELCFQKGYNWNDLPFYKKRGSFIIKNTYWNNELVISKDFLDKYGDSNTEQWTETIQFVDGVYYSKEELIIPTIRTKWEVVETPFSFSILDFKNWI